VRQHLGAVRLLERRRPGRAACLLDVVGLAARLPVHALRRAEGRRAMTGTWFDPSPDPFTAYWQPTSLERGTVA
jgi:hypothetical protein